MTRAVRRSLAVASWGLTAVMMAPSFASLGVVFLNFLLLLGLVLAPAARGPSL